MEATLNRWSLWIGTHLQRTPQVHTHTISMIIIIWPFTHLYRLNFKIMQETTKMVCVAVTYFLLWLNAQQEVLSENLLRCSELAVCLHFLCSIMHTCWQWMLALHCLLYGTRHTLTHNIYFYTHANILPLDQCHCVFCKLNNKIYPR